MRAHVGDELVVESTQPAHMRRVGTIVALRTADGSPPYLVHWLVGDYPSLIYPGPGVRMEVRHKAYRTAGRAPAAGPGAVTAPTPAPSPTAA
jgi:hypothetical protein